MTDDPGAGAATRRVEVVAGLLRSSLPPEGRWLDVSGSSMFPTIEPPGRVLVRAAAQPRPGEVWAFIGRNGELLVHRHVRQRRGGHLFRGDNRQHDDAPVEAAQLVGRVLAVHDRRGDRVLGRVDRVRGVVLDTIRRAVERSRRVAKRAVRLISGERRSQ
jgi:hypothetical protein